MVVLTIWLTTQTTERLYLPASTTVWKHNMSSVPSSMMVIQNKERSQTARQDRLSSSGVKQVLLALAALPVPPVPPVLAILPVLVALPVLAALPAPAALPALSEIHSACRKLQCTDAEGLTNHHTTTRISPKKASTDTSISSRDICS